MKSHTIALLCGVLLAGTPIASSEEEDPFANDDHPRDPREAAIEKALVDRNPQVRKSGGFFGVSTNENGTFSVDGFGSMDLLASTVIIDISPLAGVPVEKGQFWKMPIKDLSPLKGDKLKDLMITFAPLSDLSPLMGQPLEKLSVWGCAVSDITPLKGMKIKDLNIDVEDSACIRNLTPLEGMELETLRVHADGVTQGMDAIRKMSSLKEINEKPPADFLKEYDASQPVRDQLQKAEINYSELSIYEKGNLHIALSGKDANDLAKLKGLPVTWLSIDDSNVADLKPLAGSKIETLSIKSSGLTDLSPLRGMPLVGVSLECSQLKDLSPLADTQLQWLGLRCPQVTDLTPLRKLPLEQLNLRGCGVTDLTPLKDMPIELLDFDVEKFPKAREILKHMPKLSRVNFQDAKEYLNEQPSE